MTILQSVFTLGTAATTIAQPDNEPQVVTVTNLQPVNDPDAYARDGFVYLVHNRFTLANGGSATFAFTPGEHGAQFEFYEIEANSSTVYAELLEGATYTAGSAIPAFNLNRNYADDYDAVLTAATSVSGGTAINSEFVSASNQSGGVISTSKITTLEANTPYVFKFTDIGGTGTQVHFQLGWSEQFNGQHDVWLGEVGNSMRITGGQTLQLTLLPGESLSARTNDLPCEVSVMQQVYL